MKHYRVKKDTFLWKEGAILSESKKDSTGSVVGYLPVEDIWDVIPTEREYISSRFIEAPENAEWFERVYPDTITGKLFRTKDQLVDHYKQSFG